MKLRISILLIFICSILSAQKNETVLGVGDEIWSTSCDTITGETVLVQQTLLSDDIPLCCYELVGTRWVKQLDCNDVAECEDTPCPGKFDYVFNSNCHVYETADTSINVYPFFLYYTDCDTAYLIQSGFNDISGTDISEEITSECEEILTVVSDTFDCIYTIDLVSPINVNEQSINVYAVDDETFLRKEGRFLVSSSCDGILLDQIQSRNTSLDLSHGNNSSFSDGGFFLNMLLQSTTNGPITVPLSPSTAILTGSGGTALASNLTYTLANAAAFASAIRIVTVNYLATLGYTNGTHYDLFLVSINQGRLEWHWRAKHNPTSEWIGPDRNNQLLNYSGDGINALTVSKYAILSSGGPFDRSFVTPCGILRLRTGAITPTELDQNNSSYNFLAVELVTHTYTIFEPLSTLADTCDNIVLIANSNCLNDPIVTWDNGMIGDTIIDDGNLHTFEIDTCVCYNILPCEDLKCTEYFICSDFQTYKVLDWGDSIQVKGPNGVITDIPSIFTYGQCEYIDTTGQDLCQIENWTDFEINDNCGSIHICITISGDTLTTCFDQMNQVIDCPDFCECPCEELYNSFTTFNGGDCGTIFDGIAVGGNYYPISPSISVCSTVEIQDFLNTIILTCGTFEVLPFDQIGENFTIKLAGSCSQIDSISIDDSQSWGYGLIENTITQSCFIFNDCEEEEFEFPTDICLNECANEAIRAWCGRPTGSVSYEFAGIYGATLSEFNTKWTAAGYKTWIADSDGVSGGECHWFCGASDLTGPFLIDGNDISTKSVIVSPNPNADALGCENKEAISTKDCNSDAILGKLCEIAGDEDCQWNTLCDSLGVEWLACINQEGESEIIVGIEPPGPIVCTSLTTYCGNYISSYAGCDDLTSFTIDGTTLTVPGNWSTMTIAERSDWLRNHFDNNSNGSTIYTTTTAVCWTNVDHRPIISITQSPTTCRFAIALSVKIQRVCSQTPGNAPSGDLMPCEDPQFDFVEIEGCFNSIPTTQILIYQNGLLYNTIYDQDGEVLDTAEGWTTGDCPLIIPCEGETWCSRIDEAFMDNHSSGAAPIGPVAYRVDQHEINVKLSDGTSFTFVDNGPYSSYPAQLNDWAVILTSLTGKEWERRVKAADGNTNTPYGSYVGADFCPGKATPISVLATTIAPISGRVGRTFDLLTGVAIGEVETFKRCQCCGEVATWYNELGEIVEEPLCTSKNCDFPQPMPLSDPQCSVNVEGPLCDINPADPDNPVPGDIVASGIFLEVITCGNERTFSAYTLPNPADEPVPYDVIVGYLGDCASLQPAVVDAPPPSQCAPQNFYKIEGTIGTVEQQWEANAVDLPATNGISYLDAFTGTDSEGYPQHATPNSDATTTQSVAQTTNVLNANVDDQAQSDFWIMLPQDAEIREYNSTAEAVGIWMSQSCGSSKMIEVLDATYTNTSINSLGVYSKGCYRVRIYHADATQNGIGRLQMNIDGVWTAIPAYLPTSKPYATVEKGWRCDNGLYYNSDKSEELSSKEWLCEDPRCGPAAPSVSNDQTKYTSTNFTECTYDGEDAFIFITDEGDLHIRLKSNAATLIENGNYDLLDCSCCASTPDISCITPGWDQTTGSPVVSSSTYVAGSTANWTNSSTSDQSLSGDVCATYTLDVSSVTDPFGLMLGLDEAGSNITPSWQDGNHNFFLLWNGSTFTVRIYENNAFVATISTSGFPATDVTYEVCRTGTNVEYFVGGTSVQNSNANYTGDTELWINNLYSGFYNGLFTINNIELCQK